MITFKGMQGTKLDGLAYKNGIIPDGCWELFNTDQQHIVKATDVHEAHSDDSSSVAGQGDDIFEKAKELFHIQRKEVAFDSKCSKDESSKSASGIENDCKLVVVQLETTMPL